ncbi:hypothetical protein V9T40_002986 [Parthenolecanium corni]|uniref:Uncharacterized protein n=1 Tax=Parthenolecanium corni TaxID=536013 RepID=A0AAN9Y9R6_9HEMI
MDAPAPGSMYDPHAGHRSMQGITHHSPHMNHTANMFHNTPPAANHVPPNHVMPQVNDVHKRDKDSIYG